MALICSCGSEPHNVALFEDVSKPTGLDFWQYSGATGEFRLPEIMGSGAALIDYDNDGDLDLYLVQGAPVRSRAAASQPFRCRRAGNRVTACSATT